MIIMSDFSKEDNMMDNFRSIKWIFHQIIGLNKKMSLLEGMKVIWKGESFDSFQYVDLDAIYKLEDKVIDLSNKVEAIQATLRDIAN